MPCKRYEKYISRLPRVEGHSLPGPRKWEKDLFSSVRHNSALPRPDSARMMRFPDSESPSFWRRWAMSAGIGGNLNVRSVGDPVRNGAITHQGKMPYYNHIAGAVMANMQAGRGGACT